MRRTGKYYTTEVDETGKVVAVYALWAEAQDKKTWPKVMENVRTTRTVMGLVPGTRRWNRMRRSAMIRRVGWLNVGDVVVYDGQRARVKEFPTRSSVILEAIRPCDGQWSVAKVGISEVTKPGAPSRKRGM